MLFNGTISVCPRSIKRAESFDESWLKALKIKNKIFGNKYMILYQIEYNSTAPYTIIRGNVLQTFGIFILINGNTHIYNEIDDYM
jgi:hypothetical protein